MLGAGDSGFKDQQDARPMPTVCAGWGQKHTVSQERGRWLLPEETLPLGPKAKLSSVRGDRAAWSP